MSSNVVFVGNVSYSINPLLGTVLLKADEIDNRSLTSSTGTLRLELWLTTTPWNTNGSNTGYEIATYRISGTSNGTLGPNQYFSNLSQTVSYAPPPAGTYFVTMAVAEYTGTAPGVDNGYSIDDSVGFSTFLTVNADGSIRTSSLVTPTVSIQSQSIVEGDNGSKMMVFTLTLSEATPYVASLQFDTADETAVAGLDYGAVHRMVSFAAGSTSTTVSVPIYGNTRLEPARAFEVKLSQASHLQIKPNYTSPTGNAESHAMPDAWGVIFDDDSLSGYPQPSDTYLPYQWYLYSTRTELAWTHATGKGIKVAVMDQGIDGSNPELTANDNLALGRVAYTLQTGGAPVTSSDNHGTNVAGVIASARDGKGTVGVAYDAQLVSIYTPLTLNSAYLTELANGFRYAKAVDVLNNSWGFGNLLTAGTNWAFLDNASDARFAPAFAALKDLVSTGRQGLGTIVVQSAGNAYTYGDDTNLHNFQNSRYIITVGATDYQGGSSYFSTTGASILVSAPGGAGHGDYASILTTDRSGSAGYNSTNYNFTDGTSFSSPIVSGIVALMLEANPKLGYRDVQQILAYTAHQTDIGVGSWASNGAGNWNNGGLHYNLGAQSTGFGQVDALAAVRLAAGWEGVPQTVANTVEVLAAKTVGLAIPDKNASGITSSISIASDMVVERVDVSVNITHPFIGDLEVSLISPAGTVSNLMYRPAAGNLSAYGSSQNDVHFTFDTVLNWGESAAGTWQLVVRDLTGGDIGTFSDWKLDLIGHASSQQHTFYYTNEFPLLVAADAQRGILSDPKGQNDTINTAALGSDDRIDLSGATASIINGGKLTIAAGTTINNAVGGDGNDVLIANRAGGTLRGLWGNDTLTGNSGSDKLDGGSGNDILDGGAGTDTAIFHAARSNYTISSSGNAGSGNFSVLDKTASEGSDTLSGIERLQFSDQTIAYDTGGVAGQAFRIYQAAFNRAPDAAGLGFWIYQMDRGYALTDVAQGFVQSSEFQTMYGLTPSNADIVTHLYANVLHRAPDAGGAAFWTRLLDEHTLNVAQVLREFSESPENVAALVGVVQNGISYQPYG
ncbi:S8 family serine peptidase [Duganella fentianensis]|uniref:S8 family serine peptidase n=1 Tax=Duganella fentianensis TaxID=2692177 RepID=UPI0032B27A7A